MEYARTRKGDLAPHPDAPSEVFPVRQQPPADCAWTCASSSGRILSRFGQPYYSGRDEAAGNDWDDRRSDAALGNCYVSRAVHCRFKGAAAPGFEVDHLDPHHSKSNVENLLAVTVDSNCSRSFLE